MRFRGRPTTCLLDNDLTSEPSEPSRKGADADVTKGGVLSLLST